MTRTRVRLMREGDRAASRQLLTTPEASPNRRPRRSGSEADLEAIASQLNSPTDVSDDAALGFDDSGRRLDRLLDDAEREDASTVRLAYEQGSGTLTIGSRRGGAAWATHTSMTVSIADSAPAVDATPAELKPVTREAIAAHQTLRLALDRRASLARAMRRGDRARASTTRRRRRRRNHEKKTRRFAEFFFRR